MSTKIKYNGVESTPFSNTSKKIPASVVDDIVIIDESITPSGKKTITDTSEVDVTNFATAQVVDANLIAENIKKDVNILGRIGTLEEGITPSGTFTITENGTYDVSQYASVVVNVVPMFPIEITFHCEESWGSDCDLRLKISRGTGDVPTSLDDYDYQLDNYNSYDHAKLFDKHSPSYIHDWGTSDTGTSYTVNSNGLGIYLFTSQRYNTVGLTHIYVNGTDYIDEWEEMQKNYGYENPIYIPISASTQITIDFMLYD